MPLTTRTLTNAGAPLTLANGAVLANKQVVFTLATPSGFPTDVWDAVTHERVTSPVTVATDANGVFSVALWCNSRGNRVSLYSCTVPGVANVQAVLGSVDEGAGNLSWADFMVTGRGGALDPQGITALGQALDAAARAAGSAGTADADAAQTALDAAATAADRVVAVDNAGFALASANASALSAAAAAQSVLDAAAEVVLAANQVALATDQVGLAAAQVGLATAQTALATAQANAAIAAKTAAEAARDSVNTTGKVFTSTALGIAGTVDGQSFAVLSADLYSWNVYKNNAGVALFLAASYTSAYMDAVGRSVFESLDTSLYGLTLFFDADRRIMQVLPIASDPVYASFFSAFTTLQGVALTSSLYESLDPALSGVFLYLDADCRVLETIPLGSTVTALSVSGAANAAAIAALQAGAMSAGVFESLDPSLAGAVAFLDADGRILGVSVGIPATAADLAVVSNEVAAARGDQASLTARLDHGLTPYGDPIGPRANVWSLREVRERLRKLTLLEAAQLVLVFIGDSYTQAFTRYVGPLAKLLQDTYGNAGVGWLSFGWFGGPGGPWTAGVQPGGADGSARQDLLAVFQFIGAWACSYNVAANNTPSLSVTTSSTANDYIRFTVPAGHNAAQLFYAGDGTGVIAVSWDDGATYGANINLATVGAANVALAGTVAGIARIKVVAGNVSLSGIDLRSATSGVRIHKLGGSGSNAAQWASVTQATWAAQMLALGSHAHQVMHGTNDQGGGVSTAAFVTSLTTIFANLDSVLPYSDKLIVMPPENQRHTNAIGMPAYAAAAREYAVTHDVAYMDLQYYFGSVANFAFAYANANAARPWYAADLIHPDPNTGGRAIIDAEWRLLTAS